MGPAPLSDFAEALGITKRQLLRYRAADWFPAGDLGPGHVAAAREAIAANVKTRRRRRSDGGMTHQAGGAARPMTQSAAPPAPSRRAASSSSSSSSRRSRAAPRTRGQYDPAMLEALRAGQDPRAMLQAALATAGQTYAEALERGDPLLAASLGDLHKVLKEARQAEQAWMKLEEESGELIRRGVAVAALSTLLAHGVRVLEDVAALLVTQVELWTGDPGFLAAGTKARQRIVREWYEQKTREARDLAADRIGQALDKERSEA